MAEASLLSNLRINGNRLKPGQIFLVHPFQPLRHIHIAIEINIAVGRMIISAMKIQKILIGQIRYAGRVPAGLHTIRRFREQRIEHFPVQHIVRR